MSPSPRLAVLLGLAALCALVAPVGVVALLVVVVVALAVLDATRLRHAPEVGRDAPSVAARGIGSELTVSVTPAAGTRVRVRQPVVPDLELTPSEAPDALAAVLRPRRRGSHPLAPVVVRSTGPLGLLRRDRRALDTAEVRVYPDLPGARRLAQQVRTGRFREPGQRPRGPLGLGTEFETVRDYLPDDDVRQINWRATQRMQRPMSNQFREENERDVLCVVDAGRLMAAPVSGGTRLDAALDAVAAVASVADVLGDRCGTVAFDSVVRRRLPPRRSGGRGVVDALYDLEPVADDSDYELAFATIAGGKRALAMVFTDLLEVTAARPLLAAVPTLARRHAVVVVSVVDPDIEQLAADPPGRPVDAYVMAAAAAVLLEREQVVAELEGVGVTVVEATPEALPASCVGAYLRLKARARL